MKSFYELLPKKYKTKSSKYKNYKNIQIDLPMRLLIIGASGSQKTSWLANLLVAMNAFDRFFLCCPHSSQPIYSYLKEVLGDDMIIVESPSELPTVDEIEKNGNQLIIFDDVILANKKEQSIISEYFVRARHKNVSVVYISQSYFAIPKIIRNNSVYIALKKITSKKNLGMIIREYNLGKNEDELFDIYQKIRNLGDQHSLLIDLNTNTDYLKYRLNWSKLPF